MKIDNIASLAYMPYAQACVVTFMNGDRKLVSYETDVAGLTADGWLTIEGLYSMTTRKHIRAFVREFVPYEMDFSTIRCLANEHIALNINTGEVIDL